MMNLSWYCSHVQIILLACSCSIEWEVSSHVQKDGGTSVFDSNEQRQRRGEAAISITSPNLLDSGGAVEIFTTDNIDGVHARFKCVTNTGCYWSEWLNVDMRDGTIKKSFFEHATKAKQTNIQCKSEVCDNPVTIGVKISSRSLNGKGFSLVLYAEIWLRNLTSLPLTFGAPTLQMGSDDDVQSTLTGKISADSALIELTSVLEGNGFSLFGSGDGEDDDQCGDIVNLPLQQCHEVYEEVFEYVSLTDKGDIDRRWYASENHINLRQEPKDDEQWKIDCAGWPYLENGWESCSNLAGSKSFSFNGRRSFNKRHRFRRRRWFRRVKVEDKVQAMSISNEYVIFHQPADQDPRERSKREAERNVIGVHLDEKKEEEGSFLDVLNRPPQNEGVLDIMTRVANDGSILIHVKFRDGRWSTPAIVPPSGRSNGVFRACSSRWPFITKAIKECKQKGEHSAWADGGCDTGKLGIAPLEPSVYELIYQVTVLPGLWGELSRMVTVMVS